VVPGGPPEAHRAGKGVHQDTRWTTSRQFKGTPDVRQLDDALPRILQALQQPFQRRIPRAPPTSSLSSYRSRNRSWVRWSRPPSIFAQQGWSMQGNVYQAAGDFHLTITQPETKPEKTIVEKWQAWVALFVGVLTMTSLEADLPGKIRKIFAPAESTVQVIQQPLSGVIWDEGHKPLLALRWYCRN
jgi:hypothetical protein